MIGDYEVALRSGNRELYAQCKVKETKTAGIKGQRLGNEKRTYLCTNRLASERTAYLRTLVAYLLTQLGMLALLREESECRLQAH